MKPLTDAEILDQIAVQYAGDMAVAACVDECRANLENPNLLERMALTKKLAYACSTAPRHNGAEAPKPTPVAIAAAAYSATDATIH